MSFTEYFCTVDSKLNELLQSEKVIITEDFYIRLIKFLSTICNYEEEGVKIKPNVLIFTNIDELLPSITDRYFLSIYTDDSNGKSFEKKMKSLIPFCKNGWYVYINVKETALEYGVCRSFSGPIGLTINQVLLDNINSVESIPNLGIVCIEIISNYEISVAGLRKNKLIIDFRLTKVELLEIDETYESLAIDISSSTSLEDNRKEDIKKGFKKIFKTAYKKIHGTICLIVESDYEFPNEHLSDGIWFDTPIKLSDTLVELLSGASDISLSEKYYSLTGLFIEMLNTDGITIIDNSGYIRGYNVFINQSNIDTSGVVGGARKRAAYALKNCGDPKFIGVYFQSQDGYFEYEGVKKDE